MRRSVASMLGENLDPATSVVGIDIKVLAGAVFAEIVEDTQLADDMRQLARNLGVDSHRLHQAVAAAHDGGPQQVLGGDPMASAALALARAASHSPARIDASTIQACRDGELSAAAIVEIITWLSIMQLLHRLTCFLMVPKRPGSRGLLPSNASDG
ncbi:MAG TPA: hypothetical protein VFP89_11965 [Propionibacteriaceae bacterium]|nr:hypothetical protein [Propionibacteriaceae bacterium]